MGSHDTMLIAQITDLHLGFDKTLGTGPNVLRLRKVIEKIHRMRRRPDVILVTGDLVEHGEHWAYALLKGEMSRCAVPYFFAVGNHDSRDVFREIFDDAPFDGPYLHYAIEGYPVRIVVLDTMEPGRHGGAFGEDRAAWLDRTLAAAPNTPTLIAMHHPPIATGIGWMSADRQDGWVRRLEAVVAKHDQVRQLISGHIHCHIQQQFAGRGITVSRAVAPSVALELEPIAPDAPDGRDMIIDDSPGYSLHYWDGEQFTTYSQTASDGRVLVSYTDEYAFIPAMTMDIRQPEHMPGKAEDPPTG